MDTDNAMRRGFSSMELVVGVLIFSFIAAGMLAFMTYAKNYYDTTAASLELQRQARQGMNWLGRELRQAYWPVTITGPDTNGNNVAVFDTPDAAGVQYSVVSTVDGGKVLWQLRRAGPAGTTVRANDITGLAIAAVAGTHTLDIQLTARRSWTSFGRARTVTFNLTQQIEARN